MQPRLRVSPSGERLSYILERWGKIQATLVDECFAAEMALEEVPEVADRCLRRKGGCHFEKSELAKQAGSLFRIHSRNISVKEDRNE